MTFMGELIGAIIVYLVLRLIFKILKGIYSSLFDSNNDQEPVIENTSNPIEDSEPVVEETSSHDVRDDKPSDLKYNNEVYISFRNIVYKAYESFKESGYNIMWESDIDGFFIIENDPPLILDPVYAVDVRHDYLNILKLDDPFYILVRYGMVFEKRHYDSYKEQAEYLNNRATKKPTIFYTVENTGDPNFIVYYANFIASNNESLCKNTKELGEAEVFKALFIGAREAYYEGEEIYGGKLARDEINFSN